MVNFPQWVSLPKRQARLSLVQKRLQYVVMRAALEKCGAGNVAAFATAIGMERNTIYTYIRQGKFSKRTAAMAEEVFGTDLVKAEWLLNPMDIAAK